MDRPGFPHESAPSTEHRPTGSLNPMARIAAMTSGSSAGTATSPSGAAPSPAPPATSPAPGGQRPVTTADSPTVGRLSRVEPSRLWATDVAFAAWLAANLDALGETLSMKLRNGTTPHSDSPVVMATDAAGGSVVIVCERGAATDEGFGRLVRTVAASGAKHAAWVCASPEDEYGAAISWLNRSVDGRFGMVKVSAVTIGESAAAPIFELSVRTPRAEDDGVSADVPATDGPKGTTRRVDDWLDSVGARDSET